ncbi:MAG TPA: CHASE2 domain-containing protein, partial [Myxococcaceae bacterium]|nr:CHASE2 domain-containing protein [Myxococcaceae bacterium]
DEEQPRRFRLRTFLGTPVDALERALLDWRLHDVGRQSEPARDVVLVGVDDETLANAREDPHAELSTWPWPRALLGGLIGQLGREGASPVLLDWRLDTGSPRTGGDVPDDEQFRRALDATPATVLGFSVSAGPSPAVVRPLRPSLVLVGVEDIDGPGVLEVLRRVLASHAPAFAVPDGGRVRIWAGVGSEEEGRQLARRLGLPGAPLVRDYGGADRPFQVTPEEFLVRVAEVNVRGLDLEELPLARSLDVPTSALLGPRSRYGHTALAVDPDGKVRGVQHLVRWVSPEGRVHVLPSLALAGALARANSRQLVWSADRLAIVGGSSIPADRTGYALIRWDAAEGGRNGRGSLERAISAWRFVQNFYDSQEGVPAHGRNDVQKRAVVLAETFRGAGEWPATPLGDAVTRAAVVGQSLENWLDGVGISRAPVRSDVLATFALAFAGGFVALGLSGLFRSAIGALIYVLAAVAVMAGWLFFVRRLMMVDGVWLAAGGPLVAFALAWLITGRYALRTEREMREFVYGALGHYVSPNIADQVFRNVALMRPQRREVTLCYADLDGFRRMDQLLPPEVLVDLLNTYFGELTSLVRQTGGHVEYSGDALIAFWGAPVRLDGHGTVACRTALSIQSELARLRPEWQRRFGVEVRVGMALHSGEVVAGDMGSALKSNYTVVGQPVATAGRLERANRLYGTELLASGETARRAGADFVFRELDAVTLGGGVETLHQLVAKKGEVPPALVPVLEGWPEALARVRRRDFTGALAFFEAHAAVDPVSASWAKRVQRYIAHPPPDDWAGRGDLRAGG